MAGYQGNERCEPKPDFSLVTIDELWAEISSRCAGAVLVVREDLNPKQEAHNIRFSNGRIQAIGLLEQAKFELLNQPAIERPMS